MGFDDCQIKLVLAIIIQRGLSFINVSKLNWLALVICVFDPIWDTSSDWVSLK